MILVFYYHFEAVQADEEDEREEEGRIFYFWQPQNPESLKLNC